MKEQAEKKTRMAIPRVNQNIGLRRAFAKTTYMYERRVMSKIQEVVPWVKEEQFTGLLDL